MIDANGNRNGLPQIPGDAPAFPVSISGCGDNGWHGMSLRDWFAGQAIQSTCQGNSAIPAAERAYELADALIKVRDRALPSQDGAKR